MGYLPAYVRRRNARAANRLIGMAALHGATFTMQEYNIAPKDEKPKRVRWHSHPDGYYSHRFKGDAAREYLEEHGLI